MLESARFILDFMVEAPAGTTFAGKLVTNPSHSPENTFFTEDHRRVWFCVSAAMDTQIIDQLFRNCLAALDAGGQTSELRQKIADALKRLPPMQISPKTGRLMEWIQDFEEPEPGHRHVSHMFAIYPGDGITPTARPWLGCIVARMGDGDRALQMLTQRIAHFTMPNAMFSNAHGNPQVADACGFAAAIAEMLLQSHEGFINVLPALPRQWPSGKISGLRARGGFELDIEWSAGRATRTTVRSLAGNPCRLRVNGKLHELSLARGEQRTFE
jgi:alpha-L-fucosidase 2